MEHNGKKSGGKLNYIILYCHFPGQVEEVFGWGEPDVGIRISTACIGANHRAGGGAQGGYQGSLSADSGPWTQAC